MIIAFGMYSSRLIIDNFFTAILNILSIVVLCALIDLLLFDELLSSDKLKQGYYFFMNFIYMLYQSLWLDNIHFLIKRIVTLFHW